MPKNNESINNSLFDLLRSRGYRPSLLDTSGKEIPIPDEAEVFQFKFQKDGEEYGTVTISIDGLHKLVVYFGDDVANSDKSTEGTDLSWYELLNHLKRFAKSHQLSFEIRNKDHLKYDMAKREHMKKQEQLSEGYHPMGKSASYNDSIPSVKIVLQHTRQIQEGEQRFRNIARIFLENQHGERILAPTVRPGIAQVYARHLAEGGVPNDERWNHIKSLCEEYSKMAGFVRAVRGNQFNESAQRLVEAGLNHYEGLRESLGKMRGHRGYNAYFESWTPTLMENEGEETNLNELFVQETLDPRIESVMPILSKLSKNLGEMKEVGELAEWADSLLEGGDGGEASEEPIEQLEEAPGAETLAHNQDTEEKNLKAFGLAEDDVDDAKAADKKLKTPAFMRKASGDPDWKITHQDMDKAKEVNISSKEGLAALAKRLGQLEEEPNEGLAGAVAGGIAGAALTKSPQGAMTGAQVGSAIQDKMSGEEEVEESGLQAYLGNKKYGKEGMDALRKAGREHASKEKMASIRAKYDKLDEEGVAEGSGNIGPAIKSLFQKIYDQGDDEFEYFYNESPVFALYWDEYEGDLDSIISEVDPKELQIIHDELESYVEGARLAEGDKKPHPQTWHDRAKYDKLDEEGDGGQEALDPVGIPEEVDMGQYDAVKSSPKGKDEDDVFKRFREKLRQYGDELEQRQKEKEVDEGLDANQKRVGQLGPTEKVGPKGAVGKLVGANESVELSEMDKSQPSSDRGGESSGDPYAKGGKATPIKAKDAEKDAEKALNKSMDKAHKKDVKEGQEDLDAILRIIRK
jgi:hypothetical protein